MPSGDIEHLSPEIKYYEPREAIDGGEDGLEFIKKLVSGAYNLLKEEGKLIIEIGYGELEGVKTIFAEHGYEVIEVIKDLAKIDRVVVGEKRKIISGA